MTGPSENLSVQLLDGVLLLVHSDRPFARDEWLTFIDTWRDNASTVRGVLVLTPGPGPDSRGRQEVLDLLKFNPKTGIAVVTESKLARGIVTALSWAAGLRVKSFSEAHLQEAMESVSVAAGAKGGVETALQTMQRGLGVERRLVGV